MITKTKFFKEDGFSLIRLKELIKLVNLISILAIISHIVFIVASFFTSISSLLFDIIFTILFLLPIVLNYSKRFTNAKIVLLSTITADIFLGTYFLNFGDEFKFAIIIPAFLYLILFYKSNKLIVYHILLFIILYLIFIEAIYFKEESSFLTNFKDSIVSVFMIFATIAVIIYTLHYFLSLIISAQNKLEKQLDIEKAISKFSNLIISNNEDALKKGLKILLDVSKASHVFVFKNFNDPFYGLCTKKIEDVCAPGVESQLNNPELQCVPFEKAGFSRWVRNLKENNAISGRIDEFPDEEKDYLKSQGIKSILVIPIFENNKWTGFIGFADVFEERDWDFEYIYILRTVADLITLNKMQVHFKETILKQNKELKLLNSRKNKFFSIVAHDLKGPFNALLGFSQLMKNEAKKNGDFLMFKYSSELNDSAHNIYNYLLNFLEWSRFQVNKTKFIPEKTDISYLLQNVINELKSSVIAKDITILNEIPKELFLNIDKFMVKTVLMNIISNAIKFSYEQGIIKIVCESNSKEMTVKVIDNGVGINEENGKKLFQLGEGVSTTGTKNEKGTGLGLVLCKDFIEQHGGTIWFESSVDVGSTFYFTIPRE